MLLAVDENVCRPAATGRWTLFLALGAVVLTGALAVTSKAFFARGWLPKEASGTGVGATLDFITLAQGTDSWMPMLRAVRIHEEGRPIYETLFFAERVKFQYPLTSLLPVAALRRAGVTDEVFLELARIASWLAVWATIGVSVAIYFAIRRKTQPLLGDPAGAGAAGDAWMAALGLGIAGLTFYPLLKSFALGQIQTFLTLFFAVACYCWIRGSERWAGALIGLMILVKPHYAFIGLWFALRKRFGAMWAALAVAGGGLATALVVFGWNEQIKYLDVAREASRGYAYYANLSFNGLVNRLIFNGPNLVFDPLSYAPYNPLVSAATLVAGLGLLSAALVLPRARGQRAGPAEFCAVAVAVTAASPMAWEHHYGILFPVFAMLIAAYWERREIIGVLIAYALVANAWTPFNVFSALPALNILQSVALAGVLLTLVILWRRGGRQEDGKHEAVIAHPSTNISLNRSGGLSEPWSHDAASPVGSEAVLSAARDLFGGSPWLLRNLQFGRLKICPFEELIPYVPEGTTVLDVGCGRALFLGLLAGCGRNIRGVGVDTSERAVQAGEITAQLVHQKRPGSNLRIHRANHESLPEGPFEIVSLIDVVHHVPVREQEKFVAAAVARLAPGGLLLYKDMVSTPIWRVLANRFHDLLVSGDVIHEVRFATISAWAADNRLRCLRSGFLNRLWYGHEIGIFRKDSAH